VVVVVLLLGTWNVFMGEGFGLEEKGRSHEREALEVPTTSSLHSNDLQKCQNITLWRDDITLGFLYVHF
jgi:hypothetical protein